MIFQAYFKFSRFYAASCILEILGGRDTVNLSMLLKGPQIACHLSPRTRKVRAFTRKLRFGRFWYARKHRKMRAIAWKSATYTKAQVSTTTDVKFGMFEKSTQISSELLLEGIDRASSERPETQKARILRANCCLESSSWKECIAFGR